MVWQNREGNEPAALGFGAGTLCGLPPRTRQVGQLLLAGDTVLIAVESGSVAGLTYE
jgi:hypothetical protein